MKGRRLKSIWEINVKRSGMFRPWTNCAIKKRLARWYCCIYCTACFYLANDFQFPQVQRSPSKILNQFSSFHLFFKKRNRSEALHKPNESNLKCFIEAELHGLIGNFLKTRKGCILMNTVKTNLMLISDEETEIMPKLVKLFAAYTPQLKT